jgi:hypothetical protein
MIWLIISLLLLTCVNEYWHRERERKLTDRLLEKNGVEPLSEPTVMDTLPVEVKPRRKMVFPVRP